MSILKKVICTAVAVATIGSSFAFSNNAEVSAWAYNVNNDSSYPYINYPTVITNGNSENGYIRAYGLTRNRTDKSGEYHVNAIQDLLNVDMDGIIGPITDSAIKAYQRDNGLYEDGIVGKDTYRYLMKDFNVRSYRYDSGDAAVIFYIGVTKYTK